MRAMKAFNTTGPCDPELHYLIPPLERSPAALSLMKGLNYLAVSGPRQSGKTSLLKAIVDAINNERGAGADATGDMPVGWPRELWKHAFGRSVWSGTRAALLAAVNSYKGPAIDLALFEPFAAQKQQDFALGGGDRVDALEWRAMSSADAPQAESNALVSASGGGKLCGLAAQLAMDRFLAYAASHVHDDDFRVSVRLCNTAQAQERTRDLTRGMNVAATPACAVARMNDAVLLEVVATRDCFIYVVEQDSSGALCPLLPNAPIMPQLTGAIFGVPAAPATA
jgi:hypothetical protein